MGLKKQEKHHNFQNVKYEANLITINLVKKIKNGVNFDPNYKLNNKLKYVK